MSIFAEWVMIGIGGVLVIWLASRTVRRARDLNRRIDEYHREQESEEEAGRTLDPYAAMADISAPEPKEEGRRRRI